VVSADVKGADGVVNFNIADLRSKDELGILASCLHDLLHRVNEDVRRGHCQRSVRVEHSVSERACR